jgi:hypothetical protein
MSIGTIIAALVILALVLLIIKKKGGGCCGSSPAPDATKKEGEGHEHKDGCCGGH